MLGKEEKNKYMLRIEAIYAMEDTGPRRALSSDERYRMDNAESLLLRGFLLNDEERNFVDSLFKEMASA